MADFLLTQILAPFQAPCMQCERAGLSGVICVSWRTWLTPQTSSLLIMHIQRLGLPAEALISNSWQCLGGSTCSGFLVCLVSADLRLLSEIPSCQPGRSWLGTLMGSHGPLLNSMVGSHRILVSQLVGSSRVPQMQASCGLEQHRQLAAWPYTAAQ